MDGHNPFMGEEEMLDHDELAALLAADIAHEVDGASAFSLAPLSHPGIFNAPLVGDSIRKSFTPNPFLPVQHPHEYYPDQHPYNVVAPSRDIVNCELGISLPKSDVKEALELTPEDAAALRRVKLERNRKSAQKSRRRKKTLTKDLTARVKCLSAEVDRLRRHLVALQAAHSAESRRSFVNTGAERIAALKVGGGKRINATNAKLSETHTKISDEQNALELFGMWNNVCGSAGPLVSARARAAHGLAEQMDTEMLPTHTKVLLWLLSEMRDLKGSNAPGLSRIVEENKGLWAQLMKEIGIEGSQEEKLNVMFAAHVAKSLNEDLQRLALAISIIRRLQTCTRRRMEGSQMEASTVLKMLSSEQLLKLIAWTERNRDLLDKTSALSSIAAALPIDRKRKAKVRRAGMTTTTSVEGSATENGRCCNIGGGGSDVPARGPDQASCAPLAPSHLLHVLRKADEDLSNDEIRGLISFAGGKLAS